MQFIRRGGDDLGGKRDAVTCGREDIYSMMNMVLISVLGAVGKWRGGVRKRTVAESLEHITDIEC